VTFWTVAEIFRLMAITAQLSGLPMAKEIPFVFQEPDAEIQRQYDCGYKYCPAVYAFTDPRSQEIHISDDLGPYSANTVLVHELTHWLEWKAGVNQGNSGQCANERLALNTEAKYSFQYEHKVTEYPPQPCELAAP